MIGIVLAGGASRRFDGVPKGLLECCGIPLALRCANMLSEICARVMIEAPRGAGYDVLGLPLLHAPLEHAGKGPLAGMAAGLSVENDSPRVAFAPCDMPFITSDVYDCLAQNMSANGVYATTAMGAEPLVAILDAGVRSRMIEALKRDDLPRTHRILDEVGARAHFLPEPAKFFNINTPADLALAQSQIKRESLG